MSPCPLRYIFAFKYLFCAGVVEVIDKIAARYFYLHIAFKAKRAQKSINM